MRERVREAQRCDFDHGGARRKKSTGTNWSSGAIVGGGSENCRKKRRGERSRECAHTSSSFSIFFYSSTEPVTNGRQLKLGRPRAFKRRRFRSHVRNESSGTRIDASVAQKDVDDGARRAAAARFAPRSEQQDEI